MFIGKKKIEEEMSSLDRFEPDRMCLIEARTEPRPGPNRS
jgi:hypothetical protein